MSVQLVLILILFGIIEWSLTFKDALTVASATRAGARTASAEPRNPDFAEDAARAVLTAATALPDDSIEELWIYKAPADGTPTCTASACVKFIWDSAADDFVRDTSFDWDYESQNACAGESDAVGVYLKVSHDFVSGVIPGDGVTLTDNTVMNLEPRAAFEGCK